MSKRSELKRIERVVDAIGVKVKDTVFRDRDLAGIGISSASTSSASPARILAKRARTGENHPRNSPQIRAFAVIAGGAGHGRIPLRRDAKASSPKNKIYIFLSRHSICEI